MKQVGSLVFLLFLCLCLSGCQRQENASEEGIEYLEKGQYEEAVRQFEQAIEDEVNVGDAYRGIGIARWEQENYEGAREAFQMALEQKAQRTGTIYNFIGNCEMKLGNLVSAQNYFRLGLGVEGNSPELEQEMKFNTIVAYEQTGDWESAKARLSEYVAEYPQDGAAQKEYEFLQTR